MKIESASDNAMVTTTYLMFENICPAGSLAAAKLQLLMDKNQQKSHQP